MRWAMSSTSVLAAVARIAGQAAAHLVGGVRAAGVHEQRVLQHVVELLQHEHLIEAFDEPRGRFLREGVGRAHLPESIGRHFRAPDAAARASTMRRASRA